MSAIPAGYKQTDVGVIPVDWDTKPLGELASVTAGGTPSRANPLFWNGDIPWVTTAEVDSLLIDHAAQSITTEGLNCSAAKMLSPGTLLMALYGQGKTRGKVGILGIKAATNQACAAISLHRRASGKFVLHFLRSQYEAIRNLSNTGNQENLNNSLVRSITVLLPPVAEQDAIAEALSDADALIESLEQLLTKKRYLKQAAMQELLTGKNRLPGFSGEWTIKRLGDIANLYQPVTISAKQFTESGYPVYGANGVVGFYREFNHEKSQVTVTCRGSTCGTVNQTVEKSWITGNAMVVNCDNSNELTKAFLYYCLLGRDLSICITGTGQPQIVRGPLANIDVNIPCDLDEQTSIAAILSDMDAEIGELEAQLTKTRAIKQGMMQKLLTGEIRLI